MSNILKYDTSTIKFLMLNILGHDVIHDFGSDAGSDRWTRISDVIQKFIATFTINSKNKNKNKKVTGGTSQTEIQTQTPSTSSSGNVYQMRLKMGPLSEEEIYDDFYKIVNDFKNSCIFATFYYKIYENTSTTWGLSDLLKGAFGFVIEASDNAQIGELLDELFISLSDDFVSYLYSTNQSFQQFLEQATDPIIVNFALPFDEWFEILSQFMYTNYVLDELLTTFDTDLEPIISSLEPSVKTSLEPVPASLELGSTFDSNQYGPIIGSKRKREQQGGRKTIQNDKLTNINEKVKPLLNKLDEYKSKYLTESNLARLGKTFMKFRNNEASKEEIDQYNKQRDEMVTELKDILNKNGQYKSILQIDEKGYDNVPDSFIPALRLSRYGKVLNAEGYPREGALNFFDNTIYNPLKSIANPVINVRKTPDIQKLVISIKDINKEYESKKRKRDSDAISVKSPTPSWQQKTSSKLTDGERDVRQGFNEIVARTILYLTNICDKNGKLLIKRAFLNANYNNNDELLKEQIKILLCESNWISETGKQWRSVFNIFYLDSHLYNACETFLTNKKMIVANGAEIYCGEKENVGRLTNSKYVIDNAANVLNDAIKSRIFCSTSSILDGMYQCAYENSLKRIEQGNMDFTILSQNVTDNMIYNGKTTMNSNNTSKNVLQNNLLEYAITIKTPKGDINPKNVYSSLGVINPYANIDRSFKSPLIAYNVLKNTLFLFIKQMEKLNSTSVNEYKQIIQLTNSSSGSEEPKLKKQKTTINQIQSSTIIQSETPSFFRNFFNIQVDGKHSNFNFFFNILASIYYKGSGDLFQEINVCCKNGGYLNDGSYYADPTIIKWGFTKSNPDTLRMFVARDRPSACRFAVMTLFGDTAGVNRYAFGGYSSTLKTLIVSRQKVTNPNKKGKELLCKSEGFKGGYKLTKRNNGVKRNKFYTRKHK